MRTLAAILLALSAVACASGPTPDGGIATYDALKATQEHCAAKGETMKLKTEGNPARIDAYACERK
jgi:hypothetical protein